MPMTPEIQRLKDRLVACGGRLEDVEALGEEIIRATLAQVHELVTKLYYVDPKHGSLAREDDGRGAEADAVLLWEMTAPRGADQ